MGEVVESSTSKCPYDPQKMRQATGYMPIENYGIVGNLRTCALIATDGGLDFMCWPRFDSPSVFCRLLDNHKGGHFSISPRQGGKITSKQRYLPSSNILQTRFLQVDGVLNVVDFMPRPSGNPLAQPGKDSLKKWLVRRAECIRGSVDVVVNVCPAFDYARQTHTSEIVSRKLEDGRQCDEKIVFKSKTLSLQMSITVQAGPHAEQVGCPTISFEKNTDDPVNPEGVHAHVKLREGQAVSFVLSDHQAADTPIRGDVGAAELDRTQAETGEYWSDWLSRRKYHSKYQNTVDRSLLILKLLTYEPTGAIVAAPTFSLPESIGGTRNWDYRYSWVRDASFTVYILLRMGFSDEAEAYVNFMTEHMQRHRGRQEGLPIMFPIDDSTDMSEEELGHLDGYRGSKPVRIDNGAAGHVQLDIYGELMDAIYMYDKYGKPTPYDLWLPVRDLVDYVCTVWREKDSSIWEVRSVVENFVYSKIMLWVAVDRGIRLASKRNFPCRQRAAWLETRDSIYEDIMEKGYSESAGCFVQSYESRERAVLDAAVLIAPLVFFVTPNDPRFTRTLDRILEPMDKGGLSSTGFVHRYDPALAADGVGGEEGSFVMCTFWAVEAACRAGIYDRKYLDRAIHLFENMVGFGNHLRMFSEQVAGTGEQLGNTPQAFSHIALISAVFNLDRNTGYHKMAE